MLKLDISWLEKPFFALQNPRRAHWLSTTYENKDDRKYVWLEPLYTFSPRHLIILQLDHYQWQFLL